MRRKCSLSSMGPRCTIPRGRPTPGAGPGYFHCSGLRVSLDTSGPGLLREMGSSGRWAVGEGTEERGEGEEGLHGLQHPRRWGTNYS